MDDSLDLLATLKDILEFEGATVATASTRTEAESVLASGFAPSVILLDLRLGGDSGIDLAQGLKADPRWRTIPVVAISGDVPLLRRVDAGVADRKLEKPFDAEHLLDVLRELCGRPPGETNRAPGASAHGSP